MGYNSIHETVVSDIFDTIRDGIKVVGNTVSPKSAKIRNANSLTRATAGLTLVFPVICTNMLSVETATMIAKAIERKNVALLQMAFSAYNITNAPDAVAHLSKFHQNLNMSKMDLDKFMDIMDSLEESSYLSSSELQAIKEDCKRNINFVLNDSINETSLLEFSEISKYGNMQIIKEAIPRPIDPNTGKELDDDTIRKTAQGGSIPGAIPKDTQQYATNYLKSVEDDKRNDNQTALQKAKINTDITKSNNDARKALGTASDQKRQYYAAQLLPSDVKKANEMQPSMMLVNFYVNDEDRDLNVAQQAIAGVKSKLYAVDSSDILNKIITKHIDSDAMLKLVKVSTREISFVKDFLLGIDDAKLDSLSKSRKGSGSRVFKALERRAIKGKIRKSLRLENSAKAITSLVISSEEAEELKKYENIDIMQPRVIVPIMEKLNLLYFIVVDSTSEAVHMIADGETEYETYSFTSLERESGDSTYKKVVNLMTKISR